VIPLHLAADERTAFNRTLVSSHARTAFVGILNLDGESLSHVSAFVRGGSINLDADADVTRSASLELFDPTHALHFDTDSPDDGALFADRMIRCLVSLNGPLLSSRITVPVFTGPIVKLDRDGPFVTVEAQGKEIFGLGAAWRTLTIPAGAKKTDAIRHILVELMGEKRVSIPDLSTRLPKHVVVAHHDQPWKVAQRIAKSMNMQLFYDGAGTARLRHIPARPVWSFTAEKSVVTAPKVSFDMSQVRNIAHVQGGKPKGKKKPVRATVIAARTDPLSPYRLGRNGIPRYLLAEETNDHLRSSAECKRRGQQLLADSLRLATDTQYDVIPVPHLDPLDMISVVTDDTAVHHQLRKFQYPLDVQTAMSVGYWKNVRPRRKRIR
jgi:hypothetical protein